MSAPLEMLAQVFTGRLLNGAVGGIVLAGLVWLWLGVSRRQNSGTRFAIWFSALLAIGALPFLSGALSTTLPGGHRWNPSTFSPQLLLSSSLASYLFAAWIAGAGVLLLRLAIGLGRLLVVRRNCLAVDLATLDPQIGAICQDFTSSRRATLCVSTDVTVPAAIGFLRPAVVFPTSVFASLSTEEIQAILLHELAHLRRWDDWTNLAQKILKAVFFFHPAVWWIDNHLTLEREMACDDVVLAHTSSPKVYASSLISFAEKLHNARPHPLVQALVSRLRPMTLRVAQILDCKRPVGNAVWKPVLGMGAGLLAAVLGASPYMPTVVAFKADARSAPAKQIQPAAIQASSETHDRSETKTASAVALRAPVAIQANQALIAARQPRAISAAFHSRTAPAASPETSSVRHVPRVVRTRLPQGDTSLPPTFMIIQTTRYESSGHAIWTLSVWKVGGTDWSNRQLQSAWIVSSI